MPTYDTGNALVAHDSVNSWSRKNSLKTGDEVIVSMNYGKKRFRAKITRTTDTQFTIDTGSRYSIKSGRKIGSGESYDAPMIIGTPKHTREEAERINAAIVAAAEEAQREAALADILDRVEALADDTGKGIGEVLEELNQLNIQRLGDALREHMEKKTAGQ